MHLVQAVPQMTLDLWAVHTGQQSIEAWIATYLNPITAEDFEKVYSKQVPSPWYGFGDLILLNDLVRLRHVPFHAGVTILPDRSRPFRFPPPPHAHARLQRRQRSRVAQRSRGYKTAGPVHRHPPRTGKRPAYADVSGVRARQRHRGRQGRCRG